MNSQSDEWGPLPEHPAGAAFHERLSLIEGEMELYLIREQYEEATERKWMAKYKRRRARQERDALQFYVDGLARAADQRRRGTQG